MQNGKDRAEYGTQMLKKLEERVNRKGLNVTLLQMARNFYKLYPQIVNLFVPNQNYSTASNNSGSSIQLKSNSSNNETNLICTTASCKFVTSGETLVSKLSFSHINEIMKVDDPLACYFYEQECIKCTWSVRELRRQISTNLYVRAGISVCAVRSLSRFPQQYAS